MWTIFWVIGWHNGKILKCKSLQKVSGHPHNAMVHFANPAQCPEHLRNNVSHTKLVITPKLSWQKCKKWTERKRKRNKENNKYGWKNQALRLDRRDKRSENCHDSFDNTNRNLVIFFSYNFGWRYTSSLFAKKEPLDWGMSITLRAHYI